MIVFASTLTSGGDPSKKLLGFRRPPLSAMQTHLVAHPSLSAASMGPIIFADLSTAF